jgi:hypothetical protein
MSQAAQVPSSKVTDKVPRKPAKLKNGCRFGLQKDQQLHGEFFQTVRTITRCRR